jgi:hypothetical protein
MGLISGPFFGFIAFAHPLHQIFGLSRQALAFCSLNAAWASAAPFVCTCDERLPDKVLLTVADRLRGWRRGHPPRWPALRGLCAAVCTVTFFGGMSRPLSNNLIPAGPA